MIILTPSWKLTLYSESNNIDIVIGCDANAHHLLWGSTDTNDRGLALMDFKIEFKLPIDNKGQEPTFVTRTRREVLDLTLVSQFIGNYFMESIERNKFFGSNKDQMD